MSRSDPPALSPDHPPEGARPAPRTATGAPHDAARDAVVDAALAQSPALLEGIVQLASEGIISIDEAQRIHLFNRGAEEIFGYAADEVLGRPLELLIPTRYRPQHESEHLPNFARAHGTARRMGERREVFGLR